MKIIIIIQFMLIAFLVLLTSSFSARPKPNAGCITGVDGCLRRDPKLDDISCATAAPPDCKANMIKRREKCCEIWTTHPCMCEMAKDKVLKESAVKLLRMCKKPNPKCPK
ncbi:unnamed protein product [Cochlearia groenlandica]